MTCEKVTVASSPSKLGPSRILYVNFIERASRKNFPVFDANSAGIPGHTFCSNSSFLSLYALWYSAMTLSTARRSSTGGGGGGLWSSASFPFASFACLPSGNTFRYASKLFSSLRFVRCQATSSRRSASFPFASEEWLPLGNAFRYASRLFSSPRLVRCHAASSRRPSISARCRLEPYLETKVSKLAGSFRL